MSPDPKPETAAPAASARYVWYVTILLALVNALNYLDRMVVSVLAPALQADLGISDGQLGLLTGLAFALFYAACGVPIARLADRKSRKNIIAVAIALWSCMTAISGAAQSFTHLLLARIGVGVGEAGCIPPGHSLVSDYVPQKRRPLAFAVMSLGTFVGMMLGMALGGALAEAVGWRWTFVIFGIPGLIFAGVVWSTVREPPRGFYDAEAHTADAVGLGQLLRYLAARRTYCLLVGFAMLNGFVLYGFSQWWPSFYVRTFDLGMGQVGAALGSAIAIGSCLGLLIGGSLAPGLNRRSERLPLFLGAATTLLALPAALMSLFVANANVSMVLVGITAMLWNISNPPVASLIYGTAPANMRASAGAIQVFLTAIFGFGLGPTAVGFTSQFLAPTLGVEALRYALLIPAAGLPLMALMLMLAARTLKEDLGAGARAGQASEAVGRA